MKRLYFLFLILTISNLYAEEINLNGSWKFAFQENAPLSQFTNADFKATGTMAVPSCFDDLPQWSRQRGTAQYSRQFCLDHDVQNAWLRIEGMGLRGKFFIDGRCMGEEHLPYSTLELPTGPLKKGQHTLVVYLNNLLDESPKSMFHQFYDFYTFGGFYHGVSLVLQNDPIGFYKVLVRTRDYKSGEVELELLTRSESVPQKTIANVWFDEANQPMKIKFEQGKATVCVPNAKLWSVEEPNLHYVTVEAMGSKQTARFGIREIKAENRQILLNGKAIYLRGANRHETYPGFGSATTDAVMLQDLQHLRNLGGNFIRGAHYPQCDRFLQLCDEMGILVWEESLGWNNTPTQLKDSTFMADQIRQLKMMATESMNHPSVIITGFLNENRSGTKEAFRLIEKLIATVRNLNTGHLITFACNDTKVDTCNVLTDIVAFNTYPGWIGSQAGSSANLKKIMKQNVDMIVNSFRQRYPDKPIIVSEMGASGIYGVHDPDAAQWTEEFQAEYVGDIIQVTEANPNIVGLCIWQLNDAPSYYRDGATIRVKPFAQNVGGLYDAYRRPKVVVNTVKQSWRK